YEPRIHDRAVVAKARPVGPGPSRVDEPYDEGGRHGEDVLVRPRTMKDGEKIASHAAEWAANARTRIEDTAKRQGFDQARPAIRDQRATCDRRQQQRVPSPCRTVPGSAIR